MTELANGNTINENCCSNQEYPRWLTTIKSVDGTTRTITRARFIVETVLGRRLARKNIVHHADGNPANDSHDNLVVCEDVSYHNLLHKRSRALACKRERNNLAQKCSKQFFDRQAIQEQIKATGRQNYLHNICTSYMQKMRE